MGFWILLLFSVCVYGDITRKDDFFEAQFSSIRKGRMQSVILSFDNLPFDKCGVKCILHISCKTVNYNIEQMKCELTDVDFNDAKADKISRGWYNHGTQPKVDGQWGSWREVTRCSAKCEGGTTNQARDCDSPEPQHGGDDCVGKGERTIECNTHPCPVNGNWSAWRNVSTCNATCGGGTLNQTRQCDSPEPQHGGENCTGEKERSLRCNIHPCRLVNVALNKPSNQSSTYHHSAYRGNDGNMATFSLTNYDNDPWWKIDLYKDMRIEHIIFRAREYHFGKGYYKNVQIDGKSNSSSDYEVCKHLGDLKERVVEFSCDTSQQFRYLRITLKGEVGIMAVEELEVYVKE